MSIVLHKKTFQELTTDELYELLRVRSEVFVVEQNCVYQDLDGDDQSSIHLWLSLEGKTVASCTRFPSEGLSPQSEAEAMASRLCFMPSTQR